MWGQPPSAVRRAQLDASPLPLANRIVEEPGAPLLASFARSGIPQTPPPRDFPASRHHTVILSAAALQAERRISRSPSPARQPEHAAGCPTSRVLCEKWDSTNLTP